tara:strand:- start:1608 stop:1748 length:141 start_codon:yes stop_codon:yes gene_type:complete
MLDGYQRSFDKMVELGAEEVNKQGLYIRFICHRDELPKENPDSSQT